MLLLLTLEKIKAQSKNKNQNIRSLIVKGEKADEDRYPYHAAINIVGRDGRYFNICGGVLIDENWVATAAHCVKGNQQNIAVQIGKHYKYQDSDEYEEKYIEYKCLHEDFNPKTYDHDIALLYFDDSAKTKPIKLNKSKSLSPYTKDNEAFKVIGFGSTSKTGRGSKPDNLQEAEVYHVSDTKCKKRVKKMFTDWSICASGNGKEDTCIGDSGGPLLATGKSSKDDELVGIISVGPTPCLSKKSPVLYTKISDARKWIKDVLDGDFKKCK